MAKALKKVNDVDLVDQLLKTYDALLKEIGKVIIGQHDIIHIMIISLL